MRLTQRNIVQYARQRNVVIEISNEHKSEGERFQVIRCNHPGATEYGCKNIREVWDCTLEILADARKSG